MTRVLRHGLDRFAGVEQPARLEVPKRVGAVVPTRLYLSHDERVLAQTVAVVSIERRPQEGAESFRVATVTKMGTKRGRGRGPTSTP